MRNETNNYCNGILLAMLLMCLTGCSNVSSNSAQENTAQGTETPEISQSVEVESSLKESTSDIQTFESTAQISTEAFSDETTSIPEEITPPPQETITATDAVSDEYMFPEDYFVLRDWTVDGAVKNGDIWYKERTAPMVFISDTFFYREPDIEAEKFTFSGPSFWKLKGTDRKQWLLLSKYETGEEAWMLCDVKGNGIVNGMGFTAGAHDGGNNAFVMTAKHVLAKEHYSGVIPADDECVIYRIASEAELETFIGENNQNLMSDQILYEQLTAYQNGDKKDLFDQNQLLIMLYWSHFSAEYNDDHDALKQNCSGTDEIIVKNDKGTVALMQYYDTGWNEDKELVCSIIHTNKQFELNWKLEEIILSEYSDDYLDCNVLKRIDE